MKKPLVLPPGRAALVMVDFQEEHRQDVRFLVAGFSGLLAQAARLQGAARAAGVPVLHAAYVRDTVRVPRRPFEPLAVGGGPLFSAPGNPMTAICPEVAPQPGEFLALKNDASCFSEPAFGAEVARLAPEWLVVTGVWTEACVAATARDAMAAGLRVLVVKDACGSGTEAMHQTALLHLANRLYGGGICATDAAVDLFGGAEVPVWQVQGSVPIRFDLSTIQREYQAL